HLHSTVRAGWSGVFTSAKPSGWLLVRTASLRAALISLVFIATSMGTTDLAAIQAAQSLFFALALALDSLAIAGQAMIGLELGAPNIAAVAGTHRRLCAAGSGVGAGGRIVLFAG